MQIAKPLGHEHREGLADDLLREITEDPLGRAIEIGDVALTVCRDDGIVGRLGQAAKFLFTRLERLLDLLALGHIPRDFSEPAQLSRLVTQSGYHYIGPEPRAVLAYAPALLCVSFLLHRGLQFIPGFASFHILSRIEPCEVLTDDFLGPIPFDALGPGVPTDHAALGIEHVDGVVFFCVG